MIRLFPSSLSAEALRVLADFQAEVDSGIDYPVRVELAKTRWDAKENTNVGKTAFRDVKVKLAEMCPGILRCCYCEDSAPDEIEHIKPKTLYPEAVFCWENYLYACGVCNRHKGDHFAVFPSSKSKYVDVTRPRNAERTPPVHGKPVLIDLRRDDPQEFLAFEFGTGRLLPADGLRGQKWQRAMYTIEVLGLNSRTLPERRRNIYLQFRILLHAYIAHRDAGEPETELNERVRAIQEMDHQFVWQQMKRQRDLILELSDLFARAPEALDW